VSIAIFSTVLVLAYNRNKKIAYRLIDSSCAFCISQFILLYWTCTALKECRSYTRLDNQNRNIKYTGGKSALCDRGISTGWYRFGGDAGTQLSTTCVPRTDTSNRKCHTDAVSWLNGAHPSVSDVIFHKRVRVFYRGFQTRENNWINETVHQAIFIVLESL
jgi:hypothetical protein